MALMNNRMPLLAQASNINTNLTSDAVTIIGSDKDDVPGSAQTWKVWIECVLSGGTAPTWDVVVETSPDGTNWVAVANGTQRTAAGTYAEIKAVSDVVGKLRVRVTVGGTAVPNWLGKVLLLSDGVAKAV